LLQFVTREDTDCCVWVFGADSGTESSAEGSGPAGQQDSLAVEHVVPLVCRTEGIARRNVAIRMAHFMTARVPAAGGVAAIVQARMGSSRHPGKTLETLGDRSLLEWALARIQQSESVDDVIVATTELSDDDAVVTALANEPVTVVRGSSEDVLDRYRIATRSTSAETIVRVTADCPLIDPGVIDHAVATLRESGADYVSTSLDGRFPRGLDVEAFTREALLSAATEASDAPEREHVTLFIYRRPERFKCLPVVAPGWARHGELRFTVDEPADLDLLRTLVARLGVTVETSGRDVVEHLLANPDIAAINATVAHRIVQ